jgi:hypothetical protein
MSHEDQVAKIRITLEQGGRCWALMSRKRARSERKHGKLEFLGGHVEPGERPFEALLRELGEEELSGTLAARARGFCPAAIVSDIPGVPHHLYEMTLDAADFDALVFDPEESLGLVLVPLDELLAGDLNDRVTPRTRAILRAWEQHQEA